jgi:hypothetical protein
VKLIGYFRETIHENANRYANDLYHQIDKTILEKQKNLSEKVSIRNQRVSKLRAFDRLIVYYFYMIIIKYDVTLEKLLAKKVKVKKLFRQGFNENFQKIDKLILQPDIDFIKVFLAEFIVNKKNANLRLGFHKSYQAIFSYYNKIDKVKQIFNDIKKIDKTLKKESANEGNYDDDDDDDDDETSKGKEKDNKLEIQLSYQRKRKSEFISTEAAYEDEPSYSTKIRKVSYKFILYILLYIIYIYMYVFVYFNLIY